MIDGGLEKPIVDLSTERNRTLQSPEYKNRLQNIIFLRLGYKRSAEDEKGNEARNMDIVVKYSPFVRRVLNLPQYETIQNLVLAEEFEKAADLVMEEIHRQENMSHAA